jgi:hypothetical protein
MGSLKSLFHTDHSVLMLLVYRLDDCLYKIHSLIIFNNLHLPLAVYLWLRSITSHVQDMVEFFWSYRWILLLCNKSYILLCAAGINS